MLHHAISNVSSSNGISLVHWFIGLCVDSVADGCVVAALAWLVALLDWLWEPVDDVWNSLGKVGTYWFHRCPFDLNWHMAGA